MPSLLLLKDFLEKSDFRKALREIAAPFRSSLGLSLDVDELGLVCPDVVEAATWLESEFEGMGPFMLSEASPLEFKRDGVVIPYRTRVGFGYYQDVLLELAEPGAGDTVFSTHLDPGGETTIHHTGYFARGPELSIGPFSYAKILADSGFAAPTWNAKVFGGVTAVITIYDTYKAMDGVALEFLDYRLAGVAVDYPRRFADLVANFQIKHGPRVLELPGASGNVFKPQWSFHAVKLLSRPPDYVWPWVSDPDLMTQWMGGVVTGPIAEPGAERRLELELGGEQAVVVDKYREVKPPMIWEAESTKENDLFSQSQSVMTLTREAEGTRVVWEVNFVPEATFRGLELAELGDRWMEESLEKLSAIVT
jgi:uncharacterized protein YndB with AHSA1/START domain